MNTTQPTPMPTYTPEQQALIDALDQLRRSERGAAALTAFRKFLEADGRSACGLDSENLAAIVTLADSCRLFGAYTILNILTPKHRNK